MKSKLEQFEHSLILLMGIRGNFSCISKDNRDEEERRVKLCEFPEKALESTGRSGEDTTPRSIGRVNGGLIAMNEAMLTGEIGGKKGAFGCGGGGERFEGSRHRGFKPLGLFS